MVENVTVHNEFTGEVLVGREEVDGISSWNQQGIFPYQFRTAGGILPCVLEWIDVDVEDVRKRGNAAARYVIRIAHRGDGPLLGRAELKPSYVVRIVSLVVDLEVVGRATHLARHTVRSGIAQIGSQLED